MDRGGLQKLILDCFNPSGNNNYEKEIKKLEKERELRINGRSKRKNIRIQEKKANKKSEKSFNVVI